MVVDGCHPYSRGEEDEDITGIGEQHCIKVTVHKQGEPVLLARLCHATVMVPSSCVRRQPKL